MWLIGLNNTHYCTPYLSLRVFMPPPNVVWPDAYRFCPVRPCVRPEPLLTGYLAEYLTHFHQKCINNMGQRWTRHNLGSKGQRSGSRWKKVCWKQRFLALLTRCLEKCQSDFHQTYTNDGKKFQTVGSAICGNCEDRINCWSWCSALIALTAARSVSSTINLTETKTDYIFYCNVLTFPPISRYSVLGNALINVGIIIDSIAAAEHTARKWIA